MSEMKWDRPEYRRIVRAFSNGSDLFVQFEDGTDIAIPTVSLVSPDTQRTDWTDIAVTPFDLRVKAEPNTLEIPWSTLRSLTDSEFNSHIENSQRRASQRVGLTIRKLRQARKLTSKEVAERAGISAQSLSRIENGRHDVVFSTLRRILAGMGCTLRDLALAQYEGAEDLSETDPPPTHHRNATSGPGAAASIIEPATSSASSRKTSQIATSRHQVSNLPSSSETNHMPETVNRRVAQIEPKRDGDSRNTRLFDFLDRSQIILLGDPGAGKSYCFHKMAAAEGAPIYSIQTFVARNGDHQARTVYLDGLDEYRPRTSSRDANPAITVLQILRSCGSPRLRLSCRFADWLGTTDLGLFKDYCDDYAVLGLEPLNNEEALNVLSAHGFAEPKAFLRNAASRQMEWVVSNPQNLLMLADVVLHFGWPTTKRELYEQWCLRHLSEQKETLRESQLGHYAAEELLDPAGAACAGLLISGVSGIRLGPLSDAQIPSYLSVPYPKPQAVLAALTRSAFTSTEPDTVTYVHRTIAEYLGARYLGRRVDEGLPLARIQSVLGVDGYPSPSLRGLYAWLPIFVPLQAPVLISRDPIGILTYGDVASLRASHKTDLIKSMGAVATENAWFLKEQLTDYGLVGLSCPETAEQLVGILRAPNDPAPLKTLVLRAISAGEHLMLFRPDLESILADPRAPAMHRQLAAKALLKQGPGGAEIVAQLYVTAIANEKESIGLRSVVIGKLYAHSFGPPEAAAILMDAARRESPVIGEIWPLEQELPTESLMPVLEEYWSRSRSSAELPHRDLNVEVPICIERMVGRLYSEIREDDVTLVDRLLKVLLRLYEKGFSAPSGSGNLNQILSRRPGLLATLVDSAVRHIGEFSYPAAMAVTLNRFTQGAVTPEMVARRLSADFDDLTQQEPFSPDLLREYEALGGSLCSCGVETASIFERFMELGRSRPECKPLLMAYTVCEIDERRFRPSPYSLAVAEYRTRVRQTVESEARALQRGENAALQGELAKLYWGFYGGDSEHIRNKQLTLAVGEDLAISVEKAFVAMVERQPPPSLLEIAKTNAADELWWHWYAFLAGMDLLWETRRNLASLSKDTLAAAFAFSLLLDTFDADGKHFPGNAREWSQKLLRDRPEIAELACASLLTERFRQQKGASSLLHRLPDQAVAPWRWKLALQLLLDYETINASDLEQLCLIASESVEGRHRLAAISQRRIIAVPRDLPAQNAVWLVVGFVLVGGEFEMRLREAAHSHPEILWVIRSLTETSVPGEHSSGRFWLSLDHLEVIVRSFGPIFPNTSAPTGGWGDRSGYDAAMYLGGLISAISTRPEPVAGECLGRLLADGGLISYHPWISSRLTEQRELSRQARYEKPSWESARATLGGGAPANIEDLKAVFIHDLLDAAQDIRHSNLDKYRVYWTGMRNRVQVPRDEEFCRDRLAEYLRERLKPLDIWVEPEGHMAADKRADIVVLGPHGLKLPVEVKRDTHRELWLAAKNQLERLYTRDPNSSGYGVYLVFYFGPSRGGSMTPHPEQITLKESPEDLQHALNAVVPTEHRDRISCVVIDVSPPAMPCPEKPKPKVRETAAKRGIRSNKSRSSKTAPQKPRATRSLGKTGKV